MALIRMNDKTDDSNLVFTDADLICAFCVACGWLNDLLMHDLCI